MEELQKDLRTYLKENFIAFTSEGNVFTINGETYELFAPNEDDKFFDEYFHWDCDKTEYDNYIFRLGGVWYSLKKGNEMSVKLTRMKWIGEADLTNPELQSACFLGVHGPYELLNGSGQYKEWVKKAKFLGIKKLGLCEKGTLAGAFKFQTACLKEGIQSILGMEVPVYNMKKDLHYTVKVFVKDETGWQSLLKIAKLSNIDGNGSIKEEDFQENREGLFVILDPKTLMYEDVPSLWKMFSQQFYYQFDTVIYNRDDRDETYLKNLKAFFNSKFQPVAMSDAYYLEKEYSFIKGYLNRVGKTTHYQSDNQYFKTGEEYFEEFQNLFREKDFDKMFDTFELAFDNLNKIGEECNFSIETSHRHLPKYTMTPEEAAKYPDNLTMFEELIYEGLEQHIDLLDTYGEDVVSERIAREIGVIELGEVSDYFLILRDIVNWAHTQDILVGAGRGSAAGSLVTYLLGITQVNPLKYNLLFERFMNEGRVKVSLPDIDTDFPSQYRPAIKRYMEERFGETQVCSVGTYTTLQIKAAIGDFSKLFGMEIPYLRHISERINGLETKTLEDFLKLACEDKEIYKYINTYPELTNLLFLIWGQPKATSVHACAMMIFPDEKTLFEWNPVRVQNEMIVSEWEGGEMDSAGFLKEDILGIEQLDKIDGTLKLIKEHYGKTIDPYKDIPFDDPKVFEYVEKGWLGDVFQFGAKGLSSYCTKMKPNSLEELSDCAALYRPGAMENNYHNDYILRKEGFQQVEYHVGTEEVLKDTYGLFVYQEQVMALMNVLGGMDLVTCDTARKALGKKKLDVIMSLQSQFVEGYCKNFGVTEEYATSFWNEIVKASSYLFNKSHSVAYSINGYVSLWLKVHYPLEFWSISFSRAKMEEYPYYINEIRQAEGLKIAPVDINKSDINIVSDVKENSMYWALNAVKQVGDKAQEQLIKERKENGPYFSFDEFLDRQLFKGSPINKSVVENLIYSGAFDSFYDGNDVYAFRKSLLETYRTKMKVKVDKEKDTYSLAVSKGKAGLDWWWQLQQKVLSGFAFFNYRDLTKRYIENKNDGTYLDVSSLKDWDEDSYQYGDNEILVGGYVIDLDIRKSKKGPFCNIIMEQNYEFFEVVVFPEQFDEWREFIEASKGSILLLNGFPVWSKYKDKYVIQLSNNTEFVKLGLA